MQARTDLMLKLFSERMAMHSSVKNITAAQRKTVQRGCFSEEREIRQDDPAKQRRKETDRLVEMLCDIEAQKNQS